MAAAAESAQWLPEPEEVERRAVRGVALTVGRTVALQAFTFAGTIAISRLLGPRQYGIFAVAFTFQVAGRTIVDLGLPAAFIRRHEDMSHTEEQGLAAITLIGSLGITASLLVGAFVVFPLLDAHSQLLRTAAVTSVALPLYGTRVIPIIRLERRLEFRRLMWIDIADTVTFYVVALPAVIAGLGVLSLALAVVAAALASSIIAALMAPWSFGASTDLSWVRPMLGFSLRASTLAPIYLLREFIVLIVLTAIGGSAQAGYYSLAQRLFALNLSISYGVQRVTQTAFARGEGGSARDRRGAQTSVVTTLVAALPLAMIVGTAHISVDLIFGVRWHPTVALVLAAAPGALLISGTVTVLTSLALTHGDANAPMRGAVLQAALAIGLTASLVPWLGVVGAGIAMTVGAVGSTLVLLFSASRETRVLIAPTLRIAATTGIAIAVGQSLGGKDLVSLVSVAFCCAGVWFAAAALLVRGELTLVFRLLMRNLRAV